MSKVIWIFERTTDVKNVYSGSAKLTNSFFINSSVSATEWANWLLGKFINFWEYAWLKWRALNTRMNGHKLHHVHQLGIGSDGEERCFWIKRHAHLPAVSASGCNRLGYIFRFDMNNHSENIGNFFKSSNVVKRVADHEMELVFKVGGDARERIYFSKRRRFNKRSIHNVELNIRSERFKSVNLFLELSKAVGENSGDNKWGRHTIREQRFF